MFQPSYFKQKDNQQMLSFIQTYPMASIVSMSSKGLIGNHIPMLVVKRHDKYYLQGHVARVNSIWQDLDETIDVISIFMGPNAYVSPNWYPSKKDDPKTVPTWNYVAVHVTGKISFFHDKEWLIHHLKNLSSTHEARVNESWKLSDAPNEYIDKMLKAIVGVEICISDIKGNTKMSQNHPEPNRQGVIKGFNTLGLSDAASWVENPNKYNDE